MSAIQIFKVKFYQWITKADGDRSTVIVRNLKQADGMRAVVQNDTAIIEQCNLKAMEFAAKNNLTIAKIADPFPSSKYDGMVNLDYAFDVSTTI